MITGPLWAGAQQAAEIESVLHIARRGNRILAGAQQAAGKGSGRDDRCCRVPRNRIWAGA